MKENKANSLMITRIKERMREKGLNSNMLAVKAGVGRSFVYDILSGRSKNPTINNINAIAPYLDATVAYLMGSDVIDINDSYYVSIYNFAKENNDTQLVDNTKPCIILKSSILQNNLQENSNELRMHTMQDDSMSPSISAGDSLIYVAYDEKHSSQKSNGIFILKDKIYQNIFVRNIEYIFQKDEIIIRLSADNPNLSVIDYTDFPFIIAGKVNMILKKV